MLWKADLDLLKAPNIYFGLIAELDGAPLKKKLKRCYAAGRMA
jgi:hypothetical protein